MTNQNRFNYGTQSVWGGEETYNLHHATQVPIVNSVGFGYRDIDEWYEVALNKKRGHVYSRSTNPTVDVFEEKVRVLENAEAATSSSTGMSAISSTLFALLSSGDRVVSIKDTYGGTNQIFSKYLPNFGVDVKLCDTADHEQIEQEIEKGCDLLYLESPTNPTMKVLDLKRLIKAAKNEGAIVVVDNTFATPVNQHPLALDADLVIHSATKFLSGHADALGGVVCGSKELIDKIYKFREVNGATLDPTSAYLLLRGMKTLNLRIKQQEANAFEIASYLEQQPLVEEVFYPGLTSDAGHEIASQQMDGFGSMLSFSLKGGFEDVKEFLPHLHNAHLAANLGAVETIASVPRTSSHLETTAEERKELGIPEGLIRYSTGIENTEDLIQDLDQAFRKLSTKIGV